jgi:hypothetical protein
MNGPNWLGSWEGQSVHDICSSITGVDASHWTESNKVCLDLVSRKVRASVVGACTILGFATIWAGLQACVNVSFFYMAQKSQKKI